MRPADTTALLVADARAQCDRSRRSGARLIALCALALCSPHLGALPEDADQPIRITADELVYEDKLDRATYTGDVQINQGSVEIRADRVTVELEDEKIVRVRAEGEPAYYSQQLKAGEERMNADARVIVYHTSDERVDLRGDAHLVQEGNDVRGDEIAYDIRAGRVEADAGERSGRIRMILQPKRAGGAQSGSNNGGD
ncbi:MAG: lipopolysaccharide transport periplasmic protein LptA [Pseudomonadota bacterium]